MTFLVRDPGKARRRTPSRPAQNVGRRADENFEWLKEATEGPQRVRHRTTRLVLFAIHTFMDVHGHCFPTYPQIAARAGVAKRTAQTHVGRLVSAGWLLRHAELRPNKEW